MRTLRTWLAAPALVALIGVAGCFNDAFRGDEVNGAGGALRFELLIEPNRTLVEGTHFLVDRATGDLWRLEATGRAAGTWVRLADGPADAAEIDLGRDRDRASDEGE
jgi:hypothetical protein